MSFLASLSQQIQIFSQKLHQLQDPHKQTPTMEDNQSMQKDTINKNNYLLKNQINNIKNIFVNYCQLNDKIYKKIIQHQVHSNQYLNRITSLATHVQRKVQQSNIQMKDLRKTVNNTVNEMQCQTQTLKKTFLQKLQKKMDIQNLPSYIQTILQSYQQFQYCKRQLLASKNPKKQIGISTKIAGNIEVIQKKQPPSPIFQPQHLQQLQTQTLLINSLTQQLTLQNNQIYDNKYFITQISNTTQQLKQNSQLVTNNIYQLKQQINKIKIFCQNQNIKLLQIIHQIINQSVWKKKFEEFNNNVIFPQIQTINSKLIRNIDLLKKNVEETFKPKLQKINEQIAKIHQQQTNISNKMKQNEQNFHQLNKKIDKLAQTHEQYTHYIQQQLQKQTIQPPPKKQPQPATKAQLQSLQQKLSSHLNTITLQFQQSLQKKQQTINKKCQQKINKQLKHIRLDIISINKIINQFNNWIKNNSEQIQFVKDIVATKANYSDLVFFYDKKADKESFKQLKQLVNEGSKTNHINISQIFEQSQRKTKGKSEQKWQKLSSYRKKVSGFRSHLKDIKDIKGQQSNTNNKHLAIQWQSPQTLPKQYLFNGIKCGNVTLNLKSKTKPLRPSTSHTLFIL